ncbi:MAG TPA: VOC family protein [Micromonosporaceae bacterium]
MANGRRQPVAPVRKIIAGVLGTFAAFVILFGAGLPNWTIVAVGVALLLLAVSIIATSALRGSARSWVNGMAQVQSVSEPPASLQFGRCELQLMIQAPGLPVQSVKVRDPRVPVDKWPFVGAVLPVLVAFDDPRRVRVLWEDVLTHAEADELERAEASADVDPSLDETLIEHQPPPWQRRDEDFLPSDGDGRTPDETPTDVLADEIPTDRHEDPAGASQRPGKGVVLEGTVVDAPAVLPLPRRPQSADEDDDRGRPTTINGAGVTIPVTDLSRSVAFYRDRLGFIEVDTGYDNVVLAYGPTRLVLHAAPDVAPAAGIVHINLEVDDVQAVYETLRSRGVRFTNAPRAVHRGVKLEQWAASCRDPDGYSIALTQWRTRTSN